MKGMKKNLGFTTIFSPAMRIFMLLFTFSTFFVYFKKYIFFFLKPTFLVRRFLPALILGDHITVINCKPRAQIARGGKHIR